MQKIIEIIIQYENDDELWYCCGIDEAVEMLKQKRIVLWTRVAREIAAQSNNVAIRLIECFCCLGWNHRIKLASNLIRICSDEVFRFIFLKLDDEWINKMSKNDLAYILSRAEKLKESLEKYPYYSKEIELINLKLNNK